MNKIFSRQDLMVISVLILAVIGLTAYQFSQPVKYAGALISPSKAMPEFSLQSAQGPVTLSSLSGKLVVLYFGYTSCPDICPLTLANLRQAMDKIGDKAKEVQVLFISVDWKRDTPEKLASYAAAFRPDFIGITGSQSQIDSVTKDFGIFYMLNLPDKNGYYSVDHTATVLVLDRNGALTLTWPNGIQPDLMASDLIKLLKQ
ncbi:MAG: SCO family protein [Chloroflexi bacterium]|nr:SCO family protein [Chloroflexota bacterium]